MLIDPHAIPEGQVRIRRHRPQWALLAGLVSIASALPAAGQSAIHVTVSSVTAPAGSTAQLQFFLAKPAALAGAELVLDLDPSVFASVAAATAFSAAGDAAGYATIDGLHVDVNFTSASASIGQVSGNPIVAVTATTLPGLAPGTSTTVTATAGNAPWRDGKGATYSIDVATGTLTIGGALSLADLQPLTGPVAAGTVLHIDGAGFTAATAVDIQAVALSFVSFVSPNRIDVTLAGPAELTGKRVRVTNPDGTQAIFYPAWSGPPLTTDSTNQFAHAVPILPLQTFAQAIVGGTRVSQGWLVLQNPSPGPVLVAVEVLNGGPGLSQFSLPAGESSYLNLVTLGLPLENVSNILASAPIRILSLTAYDDVFAIPSPQWIVGAGPLMPASFPPFAVQPEDPSLQLSWIWQPGAPPPGAKSFTLSSSYVPLPFAVSVATASGGSWLSATPSGGATCLTAGCAQPVLAVSVDPAGLPPGIYRGSITLTPAGPLPAPSSMPTVLPVALTVAAAPFPATVAAYALFSSPGVSNPVSYPIASDQSPGIFNGPFSVSVRTDGGGNWLLASQSAPATPATVTVSANLAGLAPGIYSGEVIVTGSGNTMVIFTVAFVFGGVQLGADGNFLQFAAQSGAPAPPAQTVTVTPQCYVSGCPAGGVPAGLPFSASVTTADGACWLAAAPGSNSVSVSVNPAGLAPGDYFGVVTLASSGAAGPTQIPVMLTVWTGSAPALSVDSSSLFALWQWGTGPVAYEYADFCVSAGSAAVTIAAQASTRDGGHWLSVTVNDPVTYTCGLEASVDGSHLSPGAYYGSIVVSAAGQSLAIPVTLLVAPPPVAPLIGSVLNAASAMQDPVTPGEILSLFGVGIGSSTAGPTPVQVFFDDHPAALLYSSPDQINAVVPTGVAGKAAATLEVRYGGQSAVWTIPIAAASPAIFTLDSSGQGPAAVWNQDNTVNSASNPAPRGSVIQIFATGVNPLAAGPPVSVSIGGIGATVEYSGPAPDAAAGLYQINAVVPAGVTPASAVPVSFSIGSLTSQSGVTIAVQ